MPETVWTEGASVLPAQLTKILSPCLRTGTFCSSLIPVPSTLGGGENNPTAYRALWTIEDPELKLTDYVYGKELLDNIGQNYPYVADTGRMYCTGHSMGCMMTHYLGSTDVSHRYAAMGATSGPLMAKEDTGSQIVPMLHTMAEYDMWSYDLSQDSSMVINAADMWLIRDGLATAENVAERFGITREQQDAFAVDFPMPLIRPDSRYFSTADFVSGRTDWYAETLICLP